MQVYMIMFMLNMLIVTLAVPLYLHGQRERE